MLLLRLLRLLLLLIRLIFYVSFPIIAVHLTTWIWSLPVAFYFILCHSRLSALQYSTYTRERVRSRSRSISFRSDEIDACWIVHFSNDSLVAIWHVHLTYCPRQFRFLLPRSSKHVVFKAFAFFQLCAVSTFPSLNLKLYFTLDHKRKRAREGEKTATALKWNVFIANKFCIQSAWFESDPHTNHGWLKRKNDSCDTTKSNQTKIRSSIFIDDDTSLDGLGLTYETISEWLGSYGWTFCLFFME